MVVSCKTKDSEALIVFLYEHKSKPDKFLYHQIHTYINSINDFYKKQGQKFPVTIPILFYHGKEKLKFPNYDELFTTVEEPFFDFIPKLKVVKFDLYTHGSEYVKKAEDKFALVVLVGLLSFIFKETEDMLSFLEFLRSKHSDKFSSNKDILNLVLTYLWKFRKFAEEEPKAKIMDTLLKEIDYEPGSLIDQWVKEGEEKGIKKGKEEGLKEGIQKGIEKGEWLRMKKDIFAMLNKGFDKKLIMDILEISEEQFQKALDEGL